MRRKITRMRFEFKRATVKLRAQGQSRRGSVYTVGPGSMITAPQGSRERKVAVADLVDYVLSSP